MDAVEALTDLTDISPQIRKVVVVEADGSVVGSNLPDAQAAQRLAEGGLRLAAEADTVRGSHVAQLEAATGEGSVFVVRDDGRAIVATTRPEPTVGLVFYDLKTTLASIEAESMKAESIKAGSGDGAA